MIEEKSGPNPILFIKPAPTDRAAELNLNFDISELAVLGRLTEEIDNGIWSLCSKKIEINDFDKVVLLGAETIKQFLKQNLKDADCKIFGKYLCMNSLSRLYTSNLKNEKCALKKLCNI